MDPDRHLKLFDVARAQYRWVIANIGLALLCVALAGGAFMFGYVVAGLLIVVVSVALVINADLHQKRGHKYAGEAKQDSRP